MTMQAVDHPAVDHIGRYQLVARLGQGGMGTVYLALATGLGEFQKLLVIKQLREELTRNESFVRMFMDEAKLAARLDHPNVIHTMEAGHEAGSYFLAMEYLDGQPLSALLRRVCNQDGMLPLQIQILCDALAGLHYAHELSDYDGNPLRVVHRDVTPQNVFITYHGQVKVVDFGVAKAENNSDETSPGAFKGKFAYAAPEQALGQPVDRRCDVFAVGVMLWEVIANRRLAAGTPTPASFDARCRGTEPRIIEVVPDMDPLLAEICDTALAVDPSARYPTAEAMRAALQQYLLLSGERVDAEHLAELMRREFDAERRATHQLIKQHLLGRTLTRSTVQKLPFLVPRSAGGRRTTPADAPSVRAARAPLHGEEVRERPWPPVALLPIAARRPLPMMWGLGLLASLVLGALLFWLALGPRWITARPAAAPTLGGAPSTSLPIETRPPAPSTSMAGPPPERSEPLRRSPMRPLAESPRRGRASEPAPERRRARPRDKARGSVTAASPAARPEEARRLDGRGEPAAAVPAAQPVADMGLDLDQLPRRESANQIDLQDPYR
jgi:serine/threonine-protein kinase